MESEYPECTKLAAIADKSNAIGAFIEWMRDKKGFTLCTLEEDDELYWPTYANIEKLLAEFFDIDMNKVEAERRKMLEDLRASREEE